MESETNANHYPGRVGPQTDELSWANVRPGEYGRGPRAG